MVPRLSEVVLKKIKFNWSPEVVEITQYEDLGVAVVAVNVNSYAVKVLHVVFYKWFLQSYE